MLGLIGCSADTETGEPSQPPVPPTSVTSAIVTSDSPSPSAEPLGAITPNGRPTSTVPPSPLPEVGATCLEPSDRARRVIIPTSTGAKLTAALLGQGRRGVVLVHESNQDVCQWLPYARELVRNGYFVLDLDLSTSGYVQYEGVQPSPLGLSVSAAAGYLRKQGAGKVVLVGASMGGTASLTAAAITTPRVDGVVSLSAPAEYDDIDARTAAGMLRVPVLYGAAVDDRNFADASRVLHAATTSQKSIQIVPGTRHGVALVAQDGDPTLRRAVGAFIAMHTR
ncbi:alpha/beta fold hydrolase [Kribbella qitaiheensis]|uniref:alpha/beta fold hydrolase n=1 Tax=Kribbella qitaiheensis TaxID=1544730 RepID=UPI00361A527A